MDFAPGKLSSFRTISRGTYYKVHSVRNPPPPCGYYNINYQLVDRATPTKRMLLKKTKSRKVLDKAQPELRDVKILSKLKGYVDFKKQSPRGSFEKLQLVDNPHERRFDQQNIFPSIWSKSIKSPASDFTKTRSRDFKHLQGNRNSIDACYAPNHEFLKKSLAKTGVSFAKLLPRPPIISPKQERDLNASSVDIDKIDEYQRKSL